MPIASEKTLEIPAITAKKKKVLNNLWLNKIVISMPTATEGIARIQGSYFDSATGEIIKSDEDDSKSETIYIKDLPQCISEVPEVALAMGALLKAVPAARTWLQEKEEAEVEAVRAAEQAAADAAEQARLAESEVEQAPDEEDVTETEEQDTEE